MTRAPAGAADLVAAPGCDDAFDVRFPGGYADDVVNMQDGRIA
jgi:hypothetical protein